MPAKRRFSRTFIRRLVPTVFLCGFAFAGAIAGDAPAPSEEIHRIAVGAEKLEFRDAKSLVLEFPEWVTSVKSLNPSVIHVIAVRPNCLRIHRVAEGLAKLRVVDRRDQEYSIEMTVVSSPAGRE